MIKDAYRIMAKKYHPDMNTKEGEPDLEKFREVAEAYSVLSVKESRTSYDIQRRKDPALLFKSVPDYEARTSGINRDKSGLYESYRPEANSYAEERMAELKYERSKYNVNPLGYYNGGVPQKGIGPHLRRGKAMKEPGQYHSEKEHNFHDKLHPDSYKLDPEET